MDAKNFAQQPPRAAADDGIADFSARDHTQARMSILRQTLPIGHDAAIGQTLALPSKPGKVTALLDAHRASQPEALWRPLGHARFRPASAACGPCGGGCAGWRVH